LHQSVSLSLETVNELQLIRLEAEIRLGGETVRLKAAGKLGKNKRGDILANDEDICFLDDFGISWDLSARAQFLAEYQNEARELMPKILEELDELSILKLFAELRREQQTKAQRIKSELTMPPGHSR
jgi:hypothetical protein